MQLLDFNTLFNSGGYSLPVLVELRHPDRSSWFFTNSKENVFYNGNDYLSVPMGYSPPTSNDGIITGGNFEISIDAEFKRQLILAWFDTADDKAYLRVRAVIDNEVIREIGTMTHRHGTVTWDGEKIVWALGENPKFQMQINPIVFEPDTLID